MYLLFRMISISLILLVGYTHAAPTAATTDYRNFWEPTYHISRLNYCSFDGKACGLPVAHRYCRMMGYQKATKATIAHNVGLTNFLMSTAQCRGWTCNGFEKITCAGKIAREPLPNYYYRYRRFALPRFDHYRIDWCYEGARKCGAQAAYSFCRRMGYMKATSYKKEEKVYATKSLGDHKLCFGPQCNGFSEIICFR